MPSAPELADELELRWRPLRETAWAPLAFEILDRTIRKNLAKCFRRAKRDAWADRFAELPAITDWDAWKTAEAAVHQAVAATEHPTDSDGDLNAFAACFSIISEVTPQLFASGIDAFLKEVSFQGIMTARLAGMFDHEETDAQLKSFERLRADQ